MFPCSVPHGQCGDSTALATACTEKVPALRDGWGERGPHVPYADALWGLPAHHTDPMSR